MAKYGKSILLAPIADGDQETTTSASGSLTLYVTGNASGDTPMLALKKNGNATQRIVATNEFNLTDGNGIADFTFDGTANATISVELGTDKGLEFDGDGKLQAKVDSDALSLGVSGIDLNDTIVGARTFSNNITLSQNLIANGDITGDGDSVLSGIKHFTASFAQIDVLDVNVINSVTRTESTLEVQDKLIIAGSGSAAAAVAGGGLQIGGTNDGNAVAAILYDNVNSALDFNIGTETQIRLEAQKLLPEASDDVDLGSDDLEFKDLYLEGAAYLSTLGRALDANAQNITNINNLEVDGVASFSGNVDLGNATGDLVTVVGRFDSDLVPSTDGARALGTSGLQWSAIHVDVGHIDQLGSALDANGQNVTNVNKLEVDGLASFSGTVDLGNNAASDLVRINAGISGNITPEGDLKYLLGGGSKRFKEGHINVLHADSLGQALDAASQNITNVNKLEVDGVASFSGTLGVVGAAEFKSHVQLGEANSDTLTVTSRIASDLVPSVGNTRSLGTSGLQWKDLYVDGVAYIDELQADTLGSSLNANGQDITGVNDFSALGSAITLGNAATDIITLAGQVSSSAGITTNELQVSGFAQVASYVGTANVFATTLVAVGNGYAAGGISLESAGNVSAAGNLIAAGQSSSFGTATNAATVQFFGADQDGVEDGKERMEYLGRDNVLRFVDNDAEIMAIGGNDITDFAIDVHDNTGNQGKIRCTELVIHSDRSLKKDIKPMTDALDRVLKLQPVTYELKSNPGKADLGFIAQEVAQSVPEVCHFERGESRGLDYSRLSALLAGAVKSQQEQIDSLKAIVAKLQK